MSSQRATRPGIDVVVINYQTPDDLDHFLASYAEVEQEVDVELYAVNVSPTQADADVLEGWAGTLQSLTGATQWVDNVGYARACNDAATHGNREILGFFNADTRLQPGVLADMLGIFEDPTIGIAGPRQVDDDGRITHAGIFGTNDKPLLRGWHEQDDGNRYRDVTDAVSVSGSAYFVRRSVWNELTACVLYRAAAPEARGAFLPTQHYYEETFCSYHARAHGHRAVYVGTAEMVHRWHKASPLGGFADQLMSESRRYFRHACDLHDIAHD